MHLGQGARCSPPLLKTMLQDKRVLALKCQKGGVACVPTPASKDLRVRRRQQGQTAGLGPGVKLRVRSQFLSGGLQAWRTVR